MRSFIRQASLGLAALILIVGGATAALAGGHYVPGVEGVTAATVPPPGFHYRMYTLYYTSDASYDNHGNKQNNDLDLKVFGSSHRFVWISNYKILGADFGMDVIIPLVHTDISIGAAGIDSSQFGLGDICVDPFVLSWHTPRWDLSLALGFFAPTGDHDDVDSPGLGYWSLMGTAGATYYFDQERSWTASVLTRWLKNFEDDDTDITPGAELVAEYGVGKSFQVSPGLQLRPGLAGYSYVQLTDDDGAGSGDDERGLVHAVGPEINLFWLPPTLCQLNLRYVWEYGAENETQGQKAVMTLTFSF